MTWSKDFLLLVYLKSVWFKDYNKVFDYNRWNGFIKKQKYDGKQSKTSTVHQKSSWNSLNIALLFAVDFTGYFTLESSVELESKWCRSSNFGQIKIFARIHNDVISGP